MKAVIIIGNPKFINTPEAKQYYSDIESFLKENGVDEVVFDQGADFTCPPMADLYVAHSRGCGRYRCMSRSDRFRFLRFGDLGGINHSKDTEFLKRWKPGSTETPPPEHFQFIYAQKNAILKLIKAIKSGKTTSDVL